jgi:cyanuric acid amidohydrolase
MQHPGDLGALAALFDSGALEPANVAAVIGKTEGNGGVNDFTRGYFSFALATLLSERLGTSRSEILKRIPCVLSGGTEGVLSPHYLVLERRQTDAPPLSAGKRLAIGVAFAAPMAPEAIGRQAHIDGIAGAVEAAMRDAGIVDTNDVHFVQVKTPCVTTARAAAAAARGASVVSVPPAPSALPQRWARLIAARSPIRRCSAISRSTPRARASRPASRSIATR